MERSGIAASVGYGQEGTVGTATTATRWLPVITETMGQKITRIESDADIPGRTVLASAQWNGGPKEVGGDVQHELYQGGTGLLLTNTFGTVATTGSTTYTHVFTFGDTYGKGLTVEVGRPDVSGTTHRFRYAGCKVTDLEIGLALDKTATCGVTFMGMTEATGGSITSPSFGTDHTKPYKAITHGALTIAGAAQPVRDAKIKITRPYEERRFHGQATTSEPIQSDRTSITGEITVEFDALTAYNRFINGTEAAFVYTLTGSGSNTLTFDGNVRFDGATPQKSGRGILTLTMPVVFVSDGSTDSDALTATLVNSDSTA